MPFQPTIPFGLRDKIALAVVTFTLNHVASAETRDRVTRALRTGDPEERVPVEQVIRRAPSTEQADVVAMAAIIFDAHGRILLGRKADIAGHPYSGLWHLPGGKKEHGETDEDTLRRELWEEVGLAHLVIGEIIDEAVASDGMLIRWYQVRTSAERAIPGDDIVEARFVTQDEAREMVEPTIRGIWPETLSMLVFGAEEDAHS